MIFVYIFIGLIATLLIVASLMPKVFSIEKNIVIKQSMAEVMKHISDLNFYSQWNPWQQMDPTAKSTITGSAGIPGHKYTWVGKKIGKGSLTLLKTDNKHIDFEMEFLKPWKSKAKDNWSFEQWGDGNETKVNWQNSGDLSWPIARLMGALITKNLNYQFEKGLNNLKKMCEGDS